MIVARVDFEQFLTLLESHVEVGLEILRGFARAIFASRALGATDAVDAASAVALENRAPPPL
jgi:hypothetical protein